MENKKLNCENCNKEIFFKKNIGTSHRNHCPWCLYSVHLDLIPGDRNSKCKGKMKPIALTFKKEGEKRNYGKRQGELMIIHECQKCAKISINRIAGDDNPDSIIKIFNNSLNITEQKEKSLKKQDIQVLIKKDKQEMLNQLFGKKII